MPLFAKSEKQDKCDFIKLSCVFAFSMSGLLYVAGSTMIDSLGDLKRHSNDNREGHAAASRAFNASDIGAKTEMIGAGVVSLWCEKKEGGSEKMDAPVSESEFEKSIRMGCYVASVGLDPARPGRVIYPKLDAGLK